MPISLSGTNGVTFPSWTTATRPASPAAGQTGFNTTTLQMETYNGSAWVIAPFATSQGTSGQPLISSGAGAAPTYAALGVSAINATGTPSSSTYLRGDATWATISSSPSGTLIRAPQVLVSGTSYTTPAGCNNILIQMIGGGGGGGGMNFSQCPVVDRGGGGGGPSIFAQKYVAVTPSTTYTYAIGAGGGGGNTAPSAGSSGGTTSITIGATTYSCSGGGGGSVANNGGSGSTGSSGSATNMDSSIAAITGGTPNGGSVRTPWGTNVGGSTNIFSLTSGTTGGQSAFSYGAGGGGPYAFARQSAQASGASGYQGVIVIWEYT